MTLRSAGWLVVFGIVALLPAACGGSGTSQTSEQAAEVPAAEAPASGDAGAQAAAPAADAAQQPSSAEPSSFNPADAAGAVPGVPAAGNTAPIVAVANYFTELPGFDVAGLKPRQREKFLQQVNSEMCTCGCKNDTLAHCYVNDPNCPVVKGFVQKAYDQVKASR